MSNPDEPRGQETSQTSQPITTPVDPRRIRSLWVGQAATNRQRRFCLIGGAALDAETAEARRRIRAAVRTMHRPELTA